MARLGVFGAVAVVLAPLGCAAPEDGNWGGALAGSDAWVGVSVSDGQATGYVCGGAATVATHTRWFSGAFVSGAFELEHGGWILRGTGASGTMSGELIDPRGAALA